jgi:hypothetical protein
VKKLDTAKIRCHKTLIINKRILRFGMFGRFFHSFSGAPDPRLRKKSEAPPGVACTQMFGTTYRDLI